MMCSNVKIMNNLKEFTMQCQKCLIVLAFSFLFLALGEEAAQPTTTPNVMVQQTVTGTNANDALLDLFKRTEAQLQQTEAELARVKASAEKEKQDEEAARLAQEKQTLAEERSNLEAEKQRLAEQRQKEEEARKKALEDERYRWKHPIDPNSPDPYKSWSTEQKVNEPVNYMTQAIAYMKDKRNELNAMRYKLGVMSKNWKLKKEESERAYLGSQAILKKAVAVYVQAEKENGWPVSFGYKSFDKQEMEMEVFRKYKDFKNAKMEYGRITRGNQQLADTASVCNDQMVALDRKLQIYTDQLELFQSGKLTGEVKQLIGDLDKTIAEQQQAMDDSLAKVQNSVFATAEQERDEANMSLEAIIKEFEK